MKGLAAAVSAALGLTLLAAAPANARYVDTDPTSSGQTGATLQVDDRSRVSKDGWTVRWNVRFTCPRGAAYIGYATVQERDPASIPEIVGEDFGISARSELSGTCSGKRQRLHLRLPVQDTTIYDWASDTTRAVHEPISPTVATNTVHAIVIQDAAGYPGEFFTQYCAAPACADTTGPYLPIR